MPTAPPVTAMNQTKTDYIQSPFDLPRIPCRIQVVGRSNSGKSNLISSIIQHQYKGVWEKIYIFSSTVNVDPMWKALTEHIQETLGQIREVKDINDDIAIAHEKVDETAIRKILAQSERSIKRQHQEGKKKCKSTLLIFDDLSHTKELNKHAAGLMGELFTTSRHFGVSLIASVHSISSLGSLPRRQLSCLILFPDPNRRSYEAMAEQYSRLAGHDKKTFDAIYDLALGKNAPPYSFLTINVNETPGRIFMLRFSHFIVPEED